ncbi:MAG: hypothetical protein ACJA2W_001532 [Planctomycetota bacterium]
MAAPATSAGDDPKESGTMTLVSPSDEVVDALLEGDSKGALKALASLDLSAPEHSDAWTVYRAEALALGGDLDGAAAALTGFEESFPTSAWTSKARFERAEIARRQGNHAAAELILRAEATTLRGNERRIALGDELINAAEGLMARVMTSPTDEARQQLQSGARLLLTEAHKLETSAEFRQRTALALAKLVLAQGDWSGLAEWAEAVQEGAEPGSLLALEAAVAASRAAFAKGQIIDARRGLMDIEGSLQRALKEARSDSELSAALYELQGHALFFLGTVWRQEGQLLFAIDAWDRLIKAQPGHSKADRAAVASAETYASLSRYDDAIAAWQRAEALARSASPAEPTGRLVFMEEIQALRQREERETRLDPAARQREAVFRRAQLQAMLGRHDDAIASFAEYVASYPGAEDWNAAQEGLVTAHFGRAAGRLNASRDASLTDLEAAEAALLEFAAEYPLDRRNGEALFQWATLRESYAKEFMPEDDAKARRPFFDATIDRLEEVARRTSNSDPELSSRSLFHAAELVQNQLEDPQRAITIYQRVTGSQQGSAAGRLAEMQKTLLRVRTEGVVRPGEALTVSLETRNIQEVTVQAVRLDLGQYFRRHNTTEGIERLDLDLIAPDVEAVVPIADYEAYANLRRTIEVPVPGASTEPGVYAVTIVADGKRATTLVMRSQLDLIVKRSRDEVFALVTETTRAGRSQAAGGTEVTVSWIEDGKRETTTRPTDATGVVSFKAPRGKAFGTDTQVFATRAGHVAATHVDGQAPGRAVSLSPRADVQLDRTAYRPGEDVSFRAVLREVADGSWAMPTLSKAQIEAGQLYTTELIAPNGVALARQTATETSAYGTLSGTFELDGAAPSGTWTIRTTAPGGPNVATNFTVGEIEVPRASLELTSEQSVILRGEALSIVATAETAWGAPLAGVPLVWSDPRGVKTRAWTDSDGLATLDYRTDQALAGDQLTFTAELPEQGGLSSSTSVRVALSALAVNVSVERDVVLAGETFSARVTAKAPDGKTIPTEVRLTGTRTYAPRPGRFAEEEILSETVTTDDAGGALIALSAEAGGRLLLRVTARDRFGREVSHECSLTIAGKDDAEPLRVLAKDTSIHAGETGFLQVVDRTESGGLALMTIEGTTIMEHRVLTLETGVTELSFTADVQHVPDVRVSIAAIRGRQFHERAATFRVTRPLELILEAPSAISPEGLAEIVVRATDGLGNPVQAEIALSLVDRALLSAFPDRSASLEDVFLISGSRTPAFLSAASSTFSYDGVTRKIDAAILEEGRREVARQQLEEMQMGVGLVMESAANTPLAGSLDIEGVAFAQAPAARKRSALDQNNLLGVGGGAGGRYGGRFGGKSRRRSGSPEVGFDNPTAYWTATLVTDADGVARVSVPMPRLEATWQLDAAGATVDHRFGSAKGEIITRSPLVAYVDVPAYVREGDEPQLRGELTLETPLDAQATWDFELRVSGQRDGAKPARQTVQRGSATLEAGDVRLAYTFEKLAPIAADGGLEVEFIATLRGNAEATARDVRGCIVRPAGYLVRDTAAGTLGSDAVVDLEIGSATPLELTLIAGATEAQWLVDAALDRGGWMRAFGARPIDQTRGQGALAMASRLYGAAMLLKAAETSGGLSPATIEALRERCNSLIGALVSRVGPDGGWGRDAGSWRGLVPRQSDARTTSRAIVAFGAAREFGLSVPSTTWDTALVFAASALSKASTDEERALYCWALEASGQGNDLVLNRLHRERARLDANAGAALTLALVAADRIPMAAEVAAGLRLDPDESKARTATSSPLDRAALIVLARALAGAEANLETLANMRPWSDPVGRGMAVAATTAAGALMSSHQSPVTFEVAVGAGKPEVIQLRPADGGTREVSLLLPENGGAKVRVSLRLISGPALDYALVLEGQSETPPEAIQGFPYRIGAPGLRGPLPRWRGRELDEGFDKVSVPASVRWEDVIEGVGFGESGRLAVEYRASGRTRDQLLHDLILEVPLPAGVTASVADVTSIHSISPEIQDGVLLASIPGNSNNVTIVLDITGTRPGTWTLGAPVLRSAQNPGLAVFGGESRMTVYAPGETPQRESRPTPDERLSRGQMAFEDGDMAAALEALQPLYAEWRRQLRPRALSEVAKLLLFASLKESEMGRGNRNDRAIVDWFEILKERDPDLFVSFDDTLQIAAAYQSIGEPLRANLLYKAVIDETLGEDLRVSAALDGAGEWIRASRLAAEIWRRYPDSPAADDADLALANRLIERGLDTEGQPGIAPAKRTALVVNGIARLRRKLALGEGRGTVAADAGLALVATYAQLEQWTRAAERAELFGRVFEDPTYRDSFRYAEAVARWSDNDAAGAQAEEARAVKILEDIAKVPLKFGDGSTRWSPNRDLALYILAQVYHARKDAAKAETYYDRVDGAFADARATLQELRSERLSLEQDVIRVRPGQVATVRFDHKGIDGVNVLVYPVDLLTLALRERDLSRVTSVDLAGVTPTLEESVKLSRSVLRAGEGEIEIKLDRPGAYLAMLRGGEVHRSALILATDLDLDVVLPGDGSVRAQVMLGSTDSFAEGAAVRILAESSDRVESLESDRRGMATAEGMQGLVTVIARATRSPDGSASPEHHYAFYGSTRPAAPEAPAESPAPVQTETNYLSNVLSQNLLNTSQRQERVDKDVSRTRKGVQVQQAK